MRVQAVNGTEFIVAVSSRRRRDAKQLPSVARRPLQQSWEAQSFGCKRRPVRIRRSTWFQSLSMVKHQLTQRLRLDAAGPFRDPLPSHLPPSGATEPLRSHSQSKVRTATHDGPGYCWVRLRLCRSALGLHACTTRPGRSGCSPASSRSPGRATPPSRPSRTRNDIGPSPGTGTPPSPSPATAASAAT